MSYLKLFVSHSHMDFNIAKTFVRFIEEYFYVKDDEIRCTSVPGYELNLGELPAEQLRKDIKNATVLALISPNSLKSTWTQFELGASWVNSNKIIPILLPGVCREDLPAAMANRICIEFIDSRSINKITSDVRRYTNWEARSENDQICGDRKDRFVHEVNYQFQNMDFFNDINQIKKTSDGEVIYCSDWGKLRENSNVIARLNSGSIGDHWIMICISPEAFNPWKEPIERALRNGVKIDFIFNNTENEKILENYWRAINQKGFEYVKKSINKNKDSIVFIADKAYDLHHDANSRSSLGTFNYYLSSYPHFAISFISISEENCKRSWGLVAPYTPFKWEKPSVENERDGADWGFLVERTDPIFDRYKHSSLSLLRRLTPCKSLL